MSSTQDSNLKQDQRSSDNISFIIKAWIVASWLIASCMLFAYFASAELPSVAKTDPLQFRTDQYIPQQLPMVIHPFTQPCQKS